MILFSPLILKCIIFGSLGLAGVGLVILLTLLIRDYLKKSIW